MRKNERMVVEEILKSEAESKPELPFLVIAEKDQEEALDGTKPASDEQRARVLKLLDNC